MLFKSFLTLHTSFIHLSWRTERAVHQASTCESLEDQQKKNHWTLW